MGDRFWLKLSWSDSEYKFYSIERDHGDSYHEVRVESIIFHGRNILFKAVMKWQRVESIYSMWDICRL